MTAHTLKLFLVAEHHHGDDYDLFVWAPDADIAIRIWTRHYEFPGRLPDQVFLVPHAPPRKARALPWHKPSGVLPVWSSGVDPVWRAP